MHLYSHFILVLAPLFVSLFMSLTAHARVSICEAKLSPIKLETALTTGRELTNSHPNFYSDRDFANNYKSSSSDGVMKSIYDAEFGTRIYYSMSSKINMRTQQPEIRTANSKAQFIFFHGSGTSKSSGRNFKGQMNQLAELGYSSLALDMPFHMDGPISERFNDVPYFMKWLNKIIKKYRSPGVPVYMVGHSFGPEVIAEYLMYYPNDIDGAVLLSPAGFNPVLKWWQEEKTEKMKFGGEVPESTLGGQWAGTIAEKFKWTQGRSETDATQLNPNLKVRVLSGDREEYVPGPIGGRSRTPTGPNTYDFKGAISALLRNAEVTVEPGIGHYLFDHKDVNGVNVVLREILAVVGVDAAEAPALAKAYKARNMTAVQRLEEALANDEMFYSWVEQSFPLAGVMNIITNQKEKAAEAIFKQYSFARATREQQVVEGMQTSRSWAPAFYQELNGATAKSYSASELLLKYADPISQLSLEDQQRLGLIRKP